ncbi:hypothetical protein GGR21_004243 [Dysgonomonas hofstadii]|uniref:Uncharacterized protein n=1 Tax=Dysgonomonas hofstadii TaxID=637886 RepID=A0A840CTH2_9BACT|nr:hypothetical protein [Dysgonomonas hofstadii]
MSYHVRSPHIAIISGVSHIPKSFIFWSYTSSSTSHALPSRTRASYSNWSFSACNAVTSSICDSSMVCVPFTTGDITALIVPSTIVGKNIIHKPIAKGLSSGYTSIGSARERACHTREAT